MTNNELTQKQILNEVKKISSTLKDSPADGFLKDSETGFTNQKVEIPEDIQLSFISTATQLKIQEDEEKIKKYEVLMKETFSYFKNQAKPLNNLELIKQICADVEYIFIKDRKCGQQKKLLVYKTFLLYLSSIENVQYSTYLKQNILDMIEDQFEHNKKDLLKICQKFHKGLQVGIKIFALSGCQ